MAALAQHPFVYIPRWASIPDLSDENRYILEERDRELEDYLGSIGASAGQASISLSRPTNWSSSLPTDPVDFTTTDWADTGAHFASVGSRGSIVVDTAGRWHISAALEITNDSDGVEYPYVAHGRSGAYRRMVHGSIAAAPPDNVGNLAGGFVVDALAGDYFQAGGQFSGGVSPNYTAKVLSGRPSLLQAFLLKAT